jgi:hypothetical protein
MILSMASDLNTRQIVWAGRQTNDAPQTMGLNVPIAVEAVWIAGSYAQTYADDVVPVTFE